MSTDVSLENNVDYLPVVDDCASSPEKNEQSPVPLSTDIDAHSHMPLQDDADCLPIHIDDSSAEKLCKILISGFQLDNEYHLWVLLIRITEMVKRLYSLATHCTEN